MKKSNPNFQIPESVYEMAVYKHRCPMCGGYLQDRGGIFTCQSCPFEYDIHEHEMPGRKASEWDESEEDWRGLNFDYVPEAPDDAPSAKFYDGDAVVMPDLGVSGTVKGEPTWSKERNAWQYWVNCYDQEGPVGLELWSEPDLKRPERYDQPGEMNLKDMFGIPPEGEQYFRNAAIQEDWEGPDNEPKNDYEPGDQVEYIMADKHTLAYIVDGPIWGGEQWYWRVRFDNGGEATIADGALIPAQQWSLHEPESPEIDQDALDLLWPDIFPSNWSRVTNVVDFGDTWQALEVGIAFVYDDNTQTLYLGRNHMAILYKIKSGDRENRYGPGFRQIQDEWEEWTHHDMVFGWLYPEQRNIDLYSDIATGGLIKRPSQKAINDAKAEIENHYGEVFWLEDRIDSMLPQQAQSAILSSVPIDQTLLSNLSNDEAANAAFQALTNAGGHVVIVGGAVRDATLGNNPKDIDLMVTGLTGEQIEAALQDQGRLDFTGKAFGVYRLRRGSSEVEVAMPRTEQSTGAAHTDFEVNADPNISVETDLSRRDFTVNAMAFDPITGEVIDPHGGQVHAQQGRLSLVNDQAFADDPLRIVRALVAVSKHQLQPDDDLIKSMHDHAHSIKELPGERIQMEMDKLLSGKDPATAIELAFKSGIMPYLAPELTAMENFDQKNPHHDLTVDKHTLAVLRHMTKITNDPDLRLAALFHDSGKPESFWQDESKGPDGGGHFYKHVNDDGTEIGADHQDVGADLANAFMDRNRYPNARRERVQKLVQMHMFPYFETEKAARKFLAQVGDEKTAWDLLKVREADSNGKHGEQSDYDKEKIAKAESLLQRVIEAEHAFTVKDLAINGRDLIALGIKPGPNMKIILHDLLDKVIDNPDLNDRDTLLRLVQDVE